MAERFYRRRRIRQTPRAPVSQPLARQPKRIVVGTYQAILGSCLDIERRELLVALDATEALSQYGQIAINGAWNARLLGFLPDNCDLAPRDADHIRSFFGFKETHIPLHGHHPLPVDVVFEKISGSPAIPSDADALTIQRSGIWHNPIRNRRIAKLAKTLHTSDYEALRRFPCVYRAIGGRDTRRVAILVANIEQGLPIARKLHGWPFITGPSIYWKGLSRRDKDLLKSVRRTTSVGDHGIYTIGAIDQMDPCEFDILIRADAGLGLPPIDDCKRVLENSVDHRLLLLDFDDQGHHALGRWTRMRRRAYRDRGWHRPGADPVQERVKEFLAARPKVHQRHKAPRYKVQGIRSKV